MIKWLLFTGCIWNCSSVLMAQEKLLEGKILNENEVEGIHVLNKTTHYNSITDQDGNFSIYVNREDTLYISSVNYVPDRIIITEEIYEKGKLLLTLENLVNQLEEVFIGPKLTGNLMTDLTKIKTKKSINFDDVGIPGFKGIPEEKIVPIVPFFGIATAVDLEAMYKHLSGYYKKLRLKRKWERENNTVARIIHFYGAGFFQEAYSIPEDRIYDFLLFCIESTNVKNEFATKNYTEVLHVFKNKSKTYIARLLENE